MLTNTSSEVMVTSTTLDQPLIEVTNSRGQKNVVVSSMVNNDVYTLTLTDGSVVQLRVQNELSSSQQQQQQHPQQLVHQQENIEFSPLKFRDILSNVPKIFETFLEIRIKLCSIFLKSEIERIGIEDFLKLSNIR